MYLQIYRGGILVALLCCTGILILGRIDMNELFTRQVLETFLFLAAEYAWHHLLRPCKGIIFTFSTFRYSSNSELHST